MLRLDAFMCDMRNADVCVYDVGHRINWRFRTMDEMAGI